MHRTILLLTIFSFLSTFSYSQICPDCDYSMPFDDYIGFWEDPNGTVYNKDDILVPDEIGTWIFFKVIEGNVRKTIFTREVYCIGSTESRGRNAALQNVRLFPNPTNHEITVTHNFGKADLVISDVKGVIIDSRYNINQKSILFDVSTYESGLYLIHLVSENEKVSKLFIVN